MSLFFENQNNLSFTDDLHFLILSYKAGKILSHSPCVIITPLPSLSNMSPIKSNNLPLHLPPSEIIYNFVLSEVSFDFCC